MCILGIINYSIPVGKLILKHKEKNVKVIRIDII